MTTALAIAANDEGRVPIALAVGPCCARSIVLPPAWSPSSI
jgi:hypothetical protein